MRSAINQQNPIHCMRPRIWQIGLIVKIIGRIQKTAAGDGDADKKLDRLREKIQLMSVLKRAQTAQRQLNTFVVIPVDISVEFLNKIIQGNARP